MNDRIGEQLGNYRLLRRLGKGGFGQVYLGEHIHLKTNAAIKVLLEEVEGTQGEAFRRAFLQEAQRIAKLNHPHILRVMDFGMEKSTSYLVMEYAAHGTLSDCHPRGSKVSLDKVVRYTNEIAQALEHAHEARLIHRDVKPANVLLNEQDTILLSDFGIATIAHHTSSMRTSVYAGTAAYMAPEQLQGKPVPASDQYALAIMVYEWLCGQLPYQGDPIAVGMQHLTAPIPSLRIHNQTLLPEIEAVVHQAMAKDPKQRFPTTIAFALALEQAIAPPAPPKTTISSSYESKTQPSRNTEREAVSLTTQQQAQAIAPDEDDFIPSTIHRQKKNIHSSVPQNRTPEEERMRVLEKVDDSVKRMLSHLRQQEVVKMVCSSDLTDFPKNLWLQHVNESRSPLSPAISPIQIYDDAHGDLFIVGEQGTGKTTLLLELTQALIARALRDNTLPIPIMFSLASFSLVKSKVKTQQPIEAWLIEEMYIKYQVSYELAEQWITDRQIHPLFDDLDAISSKQYSDCVNALIAYWKQGTSKVVCSKDIQAFKRGGAPLLLQSFKRIISTQPLTLQQVDDYLCKIGTSLELLRDILREDTELQAQVVWPSVLSLLVIACYGKEAKDLYLTHHTNISLQVCSMYIDIILPDSANNDSNQRSTRWISLNGGEKDSYNLKYKRGLTWLAHLMKAQRLDSFSLDQVKREWLIDRKLGRKYDQVSFFPSLRGRFITRNPPPKDELRPAWVNG